MANFNFLNLTDSVRNKMLSEVEMDISKGELFISPRLNVNGIKEYPNFLKDSIKNGNEEFLEALIAQSNSLNETEVYGDGKTRKVAKNAALLLAQGEFNRFYIRAVCLEAIENSIDSVEVYRARESSQSRPGSELMLGEQINPNKLLEDLRTSIGVTPKILPDVNSGLSIKI